MSEFKIFASAVRKRFAEMSSEALFEVASEREAIWLTYLGAFPEGSNPIFRERTEHDCSCCRHFIYSTGNVVAIQNGALSSIWDLNGLPDHYQAVADKMSGYVKGLAIRDKFFTPFRQHGQLISRATINEVVHTFDHFAVDVPREFVASDVATKQGDARTTHQVLMRWLAELKPDAIATVVDLIGQNAVYRGAEFKRQVLAYQELQGRFLALPDESARSLFVWNAADRLDGATARLHSSAIGALIQDLSADMEVDAALGRYEKATDARNYKRPTSIITKHEVMAAMKTIEELGLEPALERRHARFSDVSVNSVLFVDNAVRSRLRGGSSLSNLLMSETKPSSFDPKAATEVSVDDFVLSILPKTTQIQLYLDNGLLSNFASITAPVHEDAPPLFKWRNPFAWSYEGNVTDSIKARVKARGGRVENVAMRVSLAWYNYDDLDIHCIEPSGRHVFYGNKCDVLDVDMNPGGGMNAHGHTRDAVENLRWIGAPQDGVYKIHINNYAKTENVDFGFEIEIEGYGLSGVESLRYERAVPHKENVPVADITVKGGRIVDVKVSDGMVSGSRSKEQWGLKTLGLARVNSLVLSPNHWDEAIGNKHFFFLLDGCLNPFPTRGIYNEYLKDDLLKHRRAFEVLGEKTKCPVVSEQLSGVGFSTKPEREKVTVTANGRPYTITF